MEDKEHKANFVSANPDEGQDFYADSPKGVLRQETSGSGTTGNGRAASPPESTIDEHRTIAYTDPHVREGIETIVDWIAGDGFNISPRSFESAMESGVGGETAGGQNSQQVSNLRRLMNDSEFWKVFCDWIRYAAIDGHAFMELVVENEQFKPKLLPTKKVSRKEDKFGDIQYYELENPNGDPINYEPHEVAELTFLKHPTDDFGRSLIEPIAEQADMLRDMEIDYSRFIATKAYPPVLWKLGDEDNNWTPDQISNWMDNVQNIGPDSMLAAPHDVETEIVGTTSTSSSAGAMRLEETFKHFENRVVTGLGVPRILMNMEASGQGEATATMPSFKRRVTRLQDRVGSAVENQILKSLLNESASLEEFNGVVPEFQFGEHSSAEKRLEIDKLLNLFNNGLLTPEAFAERAGIDPDEVPEFWAEGELMDNIRALARKGDQIQNPSGGSPTDTEGGSESAGGEVVSRQDPGEDSSSGRNKRSITEEEG